jgi:hypothetical protein
MYVWNVCMVRAYFVGVVYLPVELGDFLLVHEEQVGLVVVALDGRRGVGVLHLLALHLRA